MTKDAVERMARRGPGTESQEPFGVSVVVCCHNSTTRLPVTLAHLAAQQQTGFPWEVIVVDNASGDGTADFARQLWPPEAPAPLRVVGEPKLGVVYARLRGLAESKYALISFVDDDNWLSPEWVRIAGEVMSQHPEVGACGGYLEAEWGITPPWWLENFRGRFAIGAQGERAGDVAGSLFTAGLTVRKSAWQQLLAGGFCFTLVGRQGKTPTAGEDTELCLALRLAGWRLWYEPRLRLRHFISGERLKWVRMRREARGIGMAYPALAPYVFAFSLREKEPTGWRKWLRHLKQTWAWQMLAVFKHLLRHPGKLFLSAFCPAEGDRCVLDIEVLVGRFLQLLKMSGTYGRLVREVQQAPWKRV